ncbi:unnamed protein product, partial [Allacma fusca]
PQFLDLSKDLEQEYRDELEITSEETPIRTGYFEVTVNGKLVHSKKDGDGHVDSQPKLDKIFAAIDQAQEAAG